MAYLEIPSCASLRLSAVLFKSHQPLLYATHPNMDRKERECNDVYVIAKQFMHLKNFFHPLQMSSYD